MNTEEHKHIDALVCDELNVKSIRRDLNIVTEHGPLELVFSREEMRYFWTLNGEELYTRTPKLDAKIPDIITSFSEGSRKSYEIIRGVL